MRVLRFVEQAGSASVEYIIITALAFFTLYAGFVLLREALLSLYWTVSLLWSLPVP